MPSSCSRRAGTTSLVRDGQVARDAGMSGDRSGEADARDACMLSRLGQLIGPCSKTREGGEKERKPISTPQATGEGAWEA
jgi:hypothetical protein